MNEKVQKVLDYIEEHKEEYLELLLRFCRQPSVAATGEGIEKMAGMVVDELKKLDEVAYVRFASVYREFKDVNTFMDEIKKILDRGNA